MIRFCVLGQLTVYRDGNEITMRAAMQRRLLAVLLSRPGEQISADVIVDQLWAGDPPRTARKGAQVYVHQLRRLLGDDSRIQHHAGGYRLVVGDGELDSAEFTAGLHAARTSLEAGKPAAAIAQWDKALALWRGTEAFQGIDDLPVVLTERSRLVERRWEAVADKVSAELELGRHRRVIAELAGVLAEHPYQERLQGLNMLALYRDGRQADALEAFRTLRDRLITDLGVEPMLELRRLHAQILNHDRTLDLPAAAVSSPYRLLPRSIPEFVGRAEVLGRLDRLAMAAGPIIVITAMAGTAGIGKTTLAIHWARRAASMFPDGQLYLNLRGFDASGAAMTAAEALRSLLEAMRVPAEQIPRDIQARAGLYRGMLAGRRMLLLLDNARDAEQVRPLLPGSPDCLVLVTSRNQLTGLMASDGAFPVQLDLMAPAEAARLLAARLGDQRLRAEPGAVADIIARCAGLPLALSLVAARAATQPRTPLAQLAGELRATQGSLHAFTNPDDEFTDVRAVFTWSYEALSADAARLFRLLGLHPGPDFSVAAAASMAGHPVGAGLAELLEAHLLMSTAPGRYSFHDLLRAYANECAAASDLETAEATRRMLDHYIHTAHAADRIFAPARDSVTLPEAEPGTMPEAVDDALGWFATEHQVMLRLTRHAATVGDDRAVGWLSWALVSYLNRQGHWHDWVEVQKAALTACTRLGDLTEQALAAMNLARAYTRLGTFDLAEPHYLQARDLYQELGDETGLGHVNLNLGWMCDQQGGRYPEALDHAIRARRHYLADGHRVGQANALNSAGWYHAQLGHYAQAVTHCGEALALQETIGDRRAQANTLDSLGFAHHHLGNLTEAIRCYEQAVAIQREVGERYQNADTLVHLAETLSAAGRYPDARLALEEALAICEELNHADTKRISALLEAMPASEV